MIIFKFKKNGTEETKVFDKYYEMLRFVATSGIKDEDFIKLQFGADDDEDKKEIIGLGGLITEALNTADEMEEEEKAYEEMIAAYDEEDNDPYDLYDSDEEY